MPTRTLPLRARNFPGLALIFFGVAGLVASAQTAPNAPSPATALPAAPNYDYRNPPQGVFDDEWTEIFMSGEKVGYGHQLFRREGDLIVCEQHQEFRLTRLGSAIAMREDETSTETLDGSPRSFHSYADLGDEPTVVDGHGDGHTFDIIVQQGAFRQEQHVTFPDDTLMNWGTERLSRLKGFAPGTIYDFLSYDPLGDTFAPLSSHLVVTAPEKVSVRGQEVTAARVALRLTSKNGLGVTDAISWVDAADRTLKTTLPLGALSMDLVVATEAQARADYRPADIFSAALITLDQPLPADAATITLRLRRTDGQPLPPLPESAMEHGEVLADGSVRLTLTRPDLARQNAAAAPGPALADPAPFLVRNSYLDTSDPLVRHLATLAGGLADTAPKAVAGKLRDFVADYIDKKDFSVGFGTAAETAQSREGDCTEHAVLLAALGRVRGLPARTACGLVYLPHYAGQDNVLGFHMWAQFYFDGHWEDYDAALTDGATPYWRLGFVATDLNDISMSDFTMQLMRWMSDLKITVESTTPVTAAAKN
jgi:hypothetical protein